MTHKLPPAQVDEGEEIALKIDNPSSSNNDSVYKFPFHSQHVQMKRALEQVSPDFDGDVLETIEMFRFDSSKTYEMPYFMMVE